MNLRHRPLLVVALVAGLLWSTPAEAAPAGRETVQAKSVGPVAVIEIPRLNVRENVWSGVTDAQFDKGVGYWPGTALPGQEGNMVIGGHRTARPRPFWDIQKLRAGDAVYLTRKGRTYTYEVTRYRVVAASATWIINQTSDATLTLFTCHPRGTTRQRYVVNARLIP